MRKLLKKSRNVLWLLHKGETLWQKPAGWLSYLQMYCMLLQHEPSKIIHYSESDRRVTMTPRFYNQQLWVPFSGSVCLSLSLAHTPAFSFLDFLFLRLPLCQAVFQDCLCPKQTLSPGMSLQTSTSLWDCLFLFPQPFKPTFSMQTWSEGIKFALAYGPA